MSAGPLRVLLADESAQFRAAVRLLLEAGPGLRVVAEAGGGDEAARLAAQVRPDVVAIDLALADGEGRSAVARIMAEAPVPILVLAARSTEAAGFEALSLGALDLLERPGPGANLVEYGRTLRARLELLAGVRVARHRRAAGGLRPPAPGPAGRRSELVAVGSSLGGPRALATLLRALPADLPAPVVVVQHLAEGFAAGLAEWLAAETPLEVRLATHGARLVPGRVLLANTGRHLLVAEGHVRLGDEEPVDGFRPSVDRLLASAAASYGARACGVLLTGMGRDGAAGLRAIRDAGGATLAQDEASSAVFGMARAAAEAGAVERLLPLDELARALVELVR